MSEMSLSSLGRFRFLSQLRDRRQTSTRPVGSGAQTGTVRLPAVDLLGILQMILKSQKILRIRLMCQRILPVTKMTGSSYMFQV